MHRARSRRRYAVVLALLLVSILGILGFLVPVSGEVPETNIRVPAGEETYAFPVRTARARRESLVHWVHANGYVRPARTLGLVSRIPGTIRSVRIREGMTVREGDTLLVIEDGEFRLALERARVGLLGAQIEYQTLAKTQFLTQDDTLRRSAEARQVARRLEEARHGEGRKDGQAYLREQRELSAALAYATLRREDVLAHRSGLALAQEMEERARRDLDATVQTAPFDGMVADCGLTQFGCVVPGQRLLTLLDLSTPIVEAQVLEHDIAAVHAGQAARIQIVSLRGGELFGTVTACNPLTDPASGTFRVTVTVHTAPVTLPRPGMVATVRIATASEPEGVTIPQEAVVYREGRPVVFAVREGRAQWRYIVPGPSNGEEIAVLQGVAAGEEVITDGQFVLAHDARVSVME